MMYALRRYFNLDYVRFSNSFQEARGGINSRIFRL